MGVSTDLEFGMKVREINKISLKNTSKVVELTYF